jgi:hypothetical protein
MNKLWLDDIRDAPDETWAVARTYHEARMLVELHGWPRLVSFDHDLGSNEWNGLSFAKFLIAKDLDFQSMPADFEYKIHSANPIGRENIDGLFKSYFKFKELFNGTSTSNSAAS